MATSAVRLKFDFDSVLPTGGYHHYELGDKVRLTDPGLHLYHGEVVAVAERYIIVAATCMLDLVGRDVGGT